MDFFTVFLLLLLVVVVIILRNVRTKSSKALEESEKTLKVLSNSLEKSEFRVEHLESLNQNQNDKIEALNNKIHINFDHSFYKDFESAIFKAERGYSTEVDISNVTTEAKTKMLDLVKNGYSVIDKGSHLIISK